MGTQPRVQVCAAVVAEVGKGGRVAGTTPRPRRATHDLKVVVGGEGGRASVAHVVGDVGEAAARVWLRRRGGKVGVRWRNTHAAQHLRLYATWTVQRVHSRPVPLESCSARCRYPRLWPCVHLWLWLRAYTGHRLCSLPWAVAICLPARETPGQAEAARQAQRSAAWAAECHRASTTVRFHSRVPATIRGCACSCSLARPPCAHGAGGFVPACRR